MADDVNARDRFVTGALILVGLCTFLPGINWGTPSRATDLFLFGSPEKAWSAKQIQSAGGSWKPDASKPADADANPLLDRTRPIPLNDTPAKQAEIIRRYRLYSNHPDEMLTFMALAGMPARRFDPGMYQYGGMWFYPLGATLRVAQAAGLIKPDLTHYLDNPDQFARFYIIARLYSAAWGLIGVWAVYRLARRMFGGWALPAAAGACFALMPVVINGAHEVKPHLAGAVLVLLCALAALNYVQTGARKWWLLAGVVSGLAFGMVLTAIVAFAILPTMTLLRRQPWRQRILITAAAGGIGLATYCVTNPYVILGLLNTNSALRTNLANLRQAGALFGKANDRGALTNASLLIAEGASLPIAVFGVVGVLLIPLLARRSPTTDKDRQAPPSRTAAAVLVAVPAALSLIQFLATAAGKPGEFGRFAILPDTALLLAALALARAAGSSGEKREPLAGGILVFLTAIFGLSYLTTFTHDKNHPQSGSSRIVAAKRLAQLSARASTLAVHADPAPYSLPPVDLTRWKLLLLPANHIVPDDQPWPDVIVRPVDRPSPELFDDTEIYVRMTVTARRPWFPAHITWADNPIEILIRKDLVRQ
jgi:hypothetical protein